MIEVKMRESYMAKRSTLGDEVGAGTPEHG